MKLVPFDSATRDLSSLMDRVHEDHAPVMIARPDASAVVMMSLEDFEAYEETAYLLRSPANAARLEESLRELEEGRTPERSLEDPVP